MKKSILFLSLLFIGVSCESDDNSKQDPSDPLFESEYTPLKSLSELTSSYVYHGAKIGNRPFGAILKTNCLANNTMSFFSADNEELKKDSIMFISYIQEEKIGGKCVKDFIRTMRQVKLQKEGTMYVDIADLFYEEIKDSLVEGGIRIDTIKKVYYEGDLEIGMQGGYLRIEDKFSKYAGKDKVYQYFKKL